MSTRKPHKKGRRRIAHRRLEHLYEISKLLATFNDAQEGFPEILSSAAKVLPISSAVLIERRGTIPKTTIWPTTGLSNEQVKTAIAYARDAYAALADSTPSESADLKASAATEASLRGEEFTEHLNKTGRHKFLVLPIVLNRSSVFGVIQLETSGITDEDDLAFVDALTSLIAVALDRSYKTEDERAFHAQQLRQTQADVSERSVRLVQSQGRILDLEEERALRERFVSTLSHDLRTPLTSAKMGAQLILRRPESAENCHLLAARVASDIDRVDQMIKDLLDANRIRAGEPLSLDVDYCDLRTIAEDALRMLEAIYGHRFVLVADQPEIHGYWSAKRLRRVIENLATNAVKYGRPTRPVTITLKQTEQHVRLMVHNEGEPIQPKDQASLFGQFKRTASAQSSKKKGWGLGLTLVRGAVEAHGGKVWFESTKSRGTTFTVELPNDSRPFQATPAESASA